MEKVKNVPNLRFPEFSKPWERKKIGDISEKVNSGKTPLGGETVYVEKGILFIRSQNVLDSKLSLENSTYITEIINNTMKNSIVLANDILLNITGASLGRSCVVPKDFTIGNVNQHVCIIRLNSEYEPAFVQPIFASEKGQNIFTSLQTGSGREGLNFQSIKAIEISFPSLPEQQKIASFLTAVDEKLQALKQKKTLLEQYKKGVMQQIFSQELRFKDDNGNDFADWEEKKLGEVLIKNSKKNKNQEFKLVQSVSNKHGFVNQDEYFEDRVIASKNLSNYYVIQKGDFAYNPSRIDVGSLAYKFDDNASVISPLYISFKADKDYLNDAFLLEWFSTQQFTRQMNSSFEGSVRNTLSFESLRKIEISFPCLLEQTKISNFLSAIDDKLNHCQEKISKLEVWKKGLLQGMFV
jgi:type I restriction enzyme S subunit